MSSSSGYDAYPDPHHPETYQTTPAISNNHMLTMSRSIGYGGGIPPESAGKPGDSYHYSEHRGDYYQQSYQHQRPLSSSYNKIPGK